MELGTSDEIRFLTGMGELDRVLGAAPSRDHWCWWAVRRVLANLH